VELLQAHVRFGDWPTVTLTVPAWAPAGTVSKLYKETRDYVWSSDGRALAHLFRRNPSLGAAERNGGHAAFGAVERIPARAETHHHQRRGQVGGR
jgi:hypothetical protein